MPSLESNLLYTSAQQRNRGERELRGERRGTGGRSSIYRRPLCLFMHIKFVFVAVSAALATSALPACAQSYHFRVGAMVFTPLVEQNVREVRDSALGAIHPITVKQQPAP